MIRVSSSRSSVGNLFFSNTMKYDGHNIKIYHKRRLSRAEKSRKVLMMMKATKLGWAVAGAGKKQGWTKSRARKGRSRAGQGRRAEVE